MLLAAAWLSAIRVPFTWHKIVLLPETLVTKADSPKPISRTRWQKLASPVSSQTRPVAPAVNWQRGMRTVTGKRDIVGEIQSRLSFNELARKRPSRISREPEILAATFEGELGAGEA